MRQLCADDNGVDRRGNALLSGKYQNGGGCAKSLCLTSTLGRRVVADSYRLLATWLAETRSESSSAIKDYFDRSCESAEVSFDQHRIGSGKTRKKYYLSMRSRLNVHHRLASACCQGNGAGLCAAYGSLARYLEGLYEDIEAKMKSDEWEAAVELQRFKENQLSSYERRIDALTREIKAGFCHAG